MLFFSQQSKNDKPKKLETPLAAMLPSKYANVDVTELFPDFRPDKVSNFVCNSVWYYWLGDILSVLRQCGFRIQFLILIL